jgi:hypothetical protein
MSLNFIEGFDHWENPIMSERYQSKWYLAYMYGNDPGRFGVGKAIKATGTQYYMHADPLDPGTTNKLIIGFAFKILAGALADAPFDIIKFRDDSLTTPLEMFKVQCNSNGELEGVWGSTIVHTSQDVIQELVWNYIEVKVLLHASAGTCQFQIDGGVGEAEGTGLKTIDDGPGGTACDGVFWQTAGTDSYWYIDDLYMADSSGSTDFLGDVQVVTRKPTADFAVQFTPSTGSNWQNVDDSYMNDTDSTYNWSNTSGHEDLFTCASFGLASTDTIHAVGVNMWHRKADGGGVDMNLRLDNGVGTWTGSNIPVTSEYRLVQEILLQNPEGPADWEYDTVDTVEFGYKRV